MGLPKTYRAIARLGWTSSTGDRDGELVHSGRVPDRFEIPLGEQLQAPPAYSAVKVGGERAYRLARSGAAVETRPRPVIVYRADLLWSEGDRAAFEIECSSGTYVRALIADLGDAYCDELQRTAIGPFTLEQAGATISLGEALAFLPERPLSEEEDRAVRHGRRVPRTSEAEGPVRLTADGELVAIGEPDAAELKPVVVFAPA
jgi:tRNA pseudouridine55 synthase